MSKGERPKHLAHASNEVHENNATHGATRQCGFCRRLTAQAHTTKVNMVTSLRENEITHVRWWRGTLRGYVPRIVGHVRGLQGDASSAPVARKQCAQRSSTHGWGLRVLLLLLVRVLLDGVLLGGVLVLARVLHRIPSLQVLPLRRRRVAP